MLRPRLSWLHERIAPPRIAREDREPASFAVNQVIAGWTEGVQLMVEGEKSRFWIPEPLAYGGKRDPKGMLVFDIELLKIQ